MRKRVLVTGAAGFVGANLVRRLLHDGHEVFAQVRPGYEDWRLRELRRELHVHEVDLEDRDAVERAVPEVRPDWIFHLAAHGAYSWQTDFGRMLRTNFTGTIHLVEACLKSGFEAFINTGSSSEYGFKDHPVSEDERPDPNSHYAVTKASATLYCGYTARSRAVRIYTLRLFSVYGPYENPRRFLPTLMTLGLQGKLPPLVGPQVARDYVHVDDAVEAYLLAATHSVQEPGAIYNVGTGRQTSVREAVDTARRVLSVGAEPSWGSMPSRPWDTEVWVADNRRIHETLGWQPGLGFEEGFLRTVNWLRSRPALRAIYEQAGRGAA